MPSSATHHLAAVIPSKGSPLEFVERPTPTPGPDELLIQVKAIAINPIDYYRFLIGVFVDVYPATIGSDYAGVIIAKGSNVADNVKLGTRVLGVSASFASKGAPDYGAFQERVLVPASTVTPLPDAISFAEATVLPLAVLTAWAGWYQLGLPRNTKFTPADKKGLIIWGGASSVGSVVVQAARLLGFTTYVTASEKHHAYLNSLGATRLFDYKDAEVVDKIANAIKEDGVSVQSAYHAIGDLHSTLDVLLKVKGEGIAKVAHAPPIQSDTPKADGIEVKFVIPPMDSPEATAEFIQFVFTDWLEGKLATGEIVPSPRVQLVAGGLRSLPKALDEWKNGVSGAKIVVEL
ncbi:Dehydrogenase orsE [Psilocybe cubensis]|uniref:Dehydrogenase orsE n=2 Tax=Psilocybe cubensis TaxID=181762 RepID=A0ACB8GKA4_PSICU|nr:Dehydrogenase orsE [Psilocybe cubensis]KAH9475890.1 Dehydrogenase orsE [Psilocybe cubensis]